MYQIKIFNVPIADTETAISELNKFLNNHKIIQTYHAFSSHECGCWSFVVEYITDESNNNEDALSRNKKEDPYYSLSDEERDRYSAYKIIRKRVAAENGISTYLVFNNSVITCTFV